jgi:hypothetical protein
MPCRTSKSPPASNRTLTSPTIRQCFRAERINTKSIPSGSAEFFILHQKFDVNRHLAATPTHIWIQMQTSSLPMYGSESHKLASVCALPSHWTDSITSCQWCVTKLFTDKFSQLASQVHSAFCSLAGPKYMIIFISSCGLPIFQCCSAFGFEGDLSQRWLISSLWDFGGLRFLRPPSSRARSRRSFWQCLALATTSCSKPNSNTCLSANRTILHWTFASKFCKASSIVNYIFLFFCLAHCRWKLYFRHVLIGNAHDTLRIDKHHTFVTLELVLQHPELATYNNASLST